MNQIPRTYKVEAAQNITLIFERPLLKRSIICLNLALNNSVKKVLIIFDSRTRSKVTIEKIFKGKLNIKISNINVNLKLISKWSTWKKQLKILKKIDTMLLSLDSIIH
jgi:ABC-type uncharacterized transport system ATPase component